MDCPLSCEYLHEAHRHEKVAEVNPATLPNTDVRVTESFLQENEPLLAYLGRALFEGAMETEGSTDFDVRPALEALVRTFRSLESGIYYESRPENAYAARIAEHVQDRLTAVRERETEERGVSTIRDASVLGILVFLQRIEYMHNNGRRKSKAFLEFLGRFALAPRPEEGMAVQPNEPRIIL